MTHATGVHLHAQDMFAKWITANWYCMHLATFFEKEKERIENRMLLPKAAAVLYIVC